MKEKAMTPQQSPTTTCAFSSSEQPFFKATNAKLGSNNNFLSSSSLTILVLFFLLLRSSAGPFLSPKGEAKKSRSSFFFNFTCFLYIWIGSVTTVTIIPAFSTHYNGIIAASLFFPMVFSSIAVLFIGRFLVRLTFYTMIQFGIMEFPQHEHQQQNQTQYVSNPRYKEGGRGKFDLRKTLELNEKKRRSRRLRKITMTAFHRPFRKLARNAIQLSAALCILYAHCWSRTLSLFKVSPDDGAGALCRVAFTPFAWHNEGRDHLGAHNSSIWLIWLIAIIVMILVFAQDEWNGLHCRVITSDEDEKRSRVIADNKYVRDDMEHPQDTLEMVPWLSLFAASCVIDIILQLLVFDGRVDGRSMQSALNPISHTDDSKKRCGNDDNQSDVEKFRAFQHIYKGCIFDYSSKLKIDSEGGFWFDFMSDCGDGFNPSYQIARMLAQPNLQIKSKNGKHLNVPRGSFLINGGDLAYPNPTEQSYEKRFFRTFEDAMQPPPSFRRAKIATTKPDLPVEGWQNSFHASDKSDSEKLGLHESYKGPSSFILPGNHDWYDGLATYTRYILCRDWLGGWLIPQQRSYFVIKLAEGWWVLGMDCALNSDIDIEQYKFFAKVAESLIGPDDAVIIVNHEPHWVTDCEIGKNNSRSSEQNIRELMENHLRGKVRIRLAGDLHHYTRHVPERKKSSMNKMRRSLSRSFSFDESKSADDNLRQKRQNRVEPFTEKNRPELIVSGGGGAFLHGTHTYSKDLKYGGKRYNRVCAFPSESQSYLIGAMNLWHFRSRNYRADWLMALVYFGLVSSLFPLCGIYADYEAFNPNHDLKLLVIWCMRKVAGLMWRVVTSENVSLFWSSVVLFGAVGLQSSDKKMHPWLRLLFGLTHGITHIIAAFLCLIFVQSVAEWAIQDEIVQVSVNSEHFNGTGLASSLYENYQTHFFPVLENFTHPNSSTLAYYAEIKPTHEIVSVFQPVLQMVLEVWKRIYTAFPLLKTTLSIFDLPGIATSFHHDICTNLCSDGLECLLTHDKQRFLTIERTSYVKYMVAITMFFVCAALPLAGGIFGTWLTVSSNVFKCQGDLSSSALMVEHWKNFLKLHITQNGDLELFAIGLQKVPSRWIKDKNWDGHNSKLMQHNPTWSWKRPSKWVPADLSVAYQPEIVDFTRIHKRQIMTSSPTEQNYMGIDKL